jgi:hypothetical protein
VGGFIWLEKQETKPFLRYSGAAFIISWHVVLVMIKTPCHFSVVLAGVIVES